MSVCPFVCFRFVTYLSVGVLNLSNNGITFHYSQTCRIAIFYALPTEITIPHQQPSHFCNQHVLESHSHTKADRKAVSVNVHTWRRPHTNSSLPPPMDCHPPARFVHDKRLPERPSERGEPIAVLTLSVPHFVCR